MNVRLYTPEDYPTLLTWWEGHEVAAIPKGLLPSLGVVIEDDKGPILAAWLYRDADGKLGWIAWTVSRPGSPGRSVYRAVKQMLGAMEELAKEFKIPLLYAQLMQPGLRRVFESSGFIASHPVQQMTKLVLCR